MLEQRLGVAGGVGAEKALHEDAVERRHDEPGIQVRIDRRAKYPLLATAVDDVGEQVAVHPLQLVHVPDHVVGMLLLPQDEAHDELDRVDVLRDERVVGVDQLPDLIDLGETLQVVEHVDDVGLQRALKGGPEELLLVLEVPEDECLRDLGLLGDLREGGVGVAVDGEQAGRCLEDLLPGVHRPITLPQPRAACQLTFPQVHAQRGAGDRVRSVGPSTMPATKPPTWAQKATPPAPAWLPRAATPSMSCPRNQMRRKTTAGTSITCRKKKIGTRVTTRAPGKKRKEAPDTPAIAPLAPTIGTLEPGLESAWAPPAAQPQRR